MKYSLNWLKNRLDSGDAIKYIFFWGHAKTYQDEVGKFVLSQWYDSPFQVEGELFKTAEHWMMAKKALLFKYTDTLSKILNASTPGEAKALGRNTKNFDDAEWAAKRFEIVKEGNKHKFSQNKLLLDYLLHTANRVLVEASPLDTIWGIGLAHDVPNISNPHTWNGLNLLGFALMEVRECLREEGST